MACTLVTERESFCQQSALSKLTKHDVVDGVSMHVLLVEARGEQFNIASTTVNALLVLHSELNDQRPARVAEVIKAG